MNPPSVRLLPTVGRFLSPAAFFMMAVLASLLTGCSSTSPEPAIEPTPGYLKLDQAVGHRDFSPLRGRRIVLDPGHGGYFRGARGQDGLSEAEVNLGVALYLRGLLEWADAEVALTRTADHDFLAGTDSSLVADLSFRVSITDSLQPDVFVSIHHNSNASLDRTLNETQTYYPLGSEDASLDLARAVHRHFVRMLEIEPARILPGNFHVLRNATVPAILGEPSMISNPVIEGRLSLAASHELEAKAYFLGLLDYFADGTPRWSGAPLDTVQVPDPEHPPVLTWTFLVDPRVEAGADPAAGDGVGPEPDPATFELLRDGRPAPLQISADGRQVAWLPGAPLPHHPVVLELVGRNLRGKATPARRTLLLPAASSSLTLEMTAESPDSSAGTFAQTLMHWRTPNGAPARPGRLVWGSDGQLGVGGASAGWLLMPSGSAPSAGERIGFVADGDTIDQPATSITRDLPPGWSWRLLQPEPPGQGSSSMGLESASAMGPWRSRLPILSDNTIGRFLRPEQPVIPVRDDQPVWLETAGVLPVVIDPTSPDAAATVSPLARVWAQPLLIPALWNKTVVLDPAGGGTDDDGTGPLGTRGADLNLRTATAAAHLLRGAGTRVVLTRTGENPLPPDQKVRLANQWQADLFLTVGRSGAGGGITVGHHPGSRVGLNWAGFFLDACATLADTSTAFVAAPSYAYLLRHTACPALEVFLPGPTDLDAEDRLNQVAWPQAEARSILLSIAAALGESEILEQTLDPALLIPSLRGALPLARVDRVVLDGNFPWLPLGNVAPNPTGEISAAVSSTGAPGLPAIGARHTLEIHAGPMWQLWILEKDEQGYRGSLVRTRR